MSEAFADTLLAGLLLLGGSLAAWLLLVALLSGLRALGLPRRRGPQER